MIPVTVHAGDTLSQIASEHGVSLSALEAANSQFPDPNVIFAGQSVVIPSGGGFAQWSPSSSSHASVPSHSASGHTSSSPRSSRWTSRSSRSSSESSSPSSSSGTSGQSSTSGSRSSRWTPSSTHSPGSSSRSVSSPSVRHSSGSASSSTSSSGGSDITNIPGVPQSFVKCVAFRESTNGTNAALNGGVFGIIRASGINVNGQSLSAQKQAFQRIYQTTGPRAWAADHCPGT